MELSGSGGGGQRRVLAVTSGGQTHNCSLGHSFRISACWKIFIISGWEGVGRTSRGPLLKQLEPQKE